MVGTPLRSRCVLTVHAVHREAQELRLKFVSAVKELLTDSLAVTVKPRKHRKVSW